MSLQMVGVSCVVDFGVAPAVTGVDPLTFWGWTNITTLTNTRRIFSKRDATSGWDLAEVTGGFLKATRGRATTSSSYTTNNLAMVAGRWYFLAVVADSNAAQTMRIYVGDGNTPCVEATYSTATAGSGALGSDVAAVLKVGQVSSLASQQTVASFGVAGVAMTVAELQALQAGSIQRPRVPRMVFYCRPGANGTGPTLDESGNNNHGTPAAGAIPTSEMPSRPRRKR